MKGIEYVNKVISNNKNLPESLIEKVNSFYWKEGVRKKLSSLDSNGVFVKHIGSFLVSPFKIRQYILKVISKIRTTKRSIKYTEETKQRIVDRLYEDLKDLLVRRNENLKYISSQRNNEQVIRLSKVDSKSNTES